MGIPPDIIPPLPSHLIRKLLLADDDVDDCLLFTEALLETGLAISITYVHNGEQLMQCLNKDKELPDVVFLDVNMPRKNGFECLSEIKAFDHLKDLPIIVLSTSLEPEMINRLYKSGAQQCFRKPNSFSELKELILTAINVDGGKNRSEAPAGNSIATS